MLKPVASIPDLPYSIDESKLDPLLYSGINEALTYRNVTRRYQHLVQTAKPRNEITKVFFVTLGCLCTMVLPFIWFFAWLLGVAHIFGASAVYWLVCGVLGCAGMLLGGWLGLEGAEPYERIEVGLGGGTVGAIIGVVVGIMAVALLPWGSMMLGVLAFALAWKVDFSPEEPRYAVRFLEKDDRALVALSLHEVIGELNNLAKALRRRQINVEHGKSDRRLPEFEREVAKHYEDTVREVNILTELVRREGEIGKSLFVDPSGSLGRIHDLQASLHRTSLDARDRLDVALELKGM